MKKKFSPQVFVFVVGAILMLVGSIYIVSMNPTGNVVAPNGPRCTDSDGGQAYDLSGKCLQYRPNGKISGMREDVCLSDGILREYYCNAKAFGLTAVCTAQVVRCSNGCGVYQDGSRCN